MPHAHTYENIEEDDHEGEKAEKMLRQRYFEYKESESLSGIKIVEKIREKLKEWGEKNKHTKPIPKKNGINSFENCYAHGKKFSRGCHSLDELQKVIQIFYELKSPGSLEYFPQLHFENCLSVKEVWETSTDSEIVKHPHILEPLSGKNLGTLKFGEWLNDEVINAYIRLVNKYSIDKDLKKRSMNTFFFKELESSKLDENKIRRIFKRHNIEIDKIKNLFLPVNKSNSHWSFLSLDIDNNT